MRKREIWLDIDPRRPEVHSKYIANTDEVLTMFRPNGREERMDHLQWKRRIVSACKKAGTYQKCFTDVIETLAQIMEDRDKVHEQYVEDGCRPTVIHTNKAKEANVVKNPMLVMEMELNAQALSYWRDLGLTPAGLRKLNAEVVKENQSGGNLEKILEGLAADG